MFLIAPTDIGWFHRVRSDFTGDTVNFWTPTPWGETRFRGGEHFYFMLKAPIRLIGGYGVFEQYENLTPEEAWDKFGTKNGVDTLGQLIEKTSKLSGKRSTRPAGGKIGCYTLSNVITLDDAEMIDLVELAKDTKPKDEIVFPRQVVKKKYFDIFDYLAEPKTPAKSKDFELVKGAPDRHLVSRKHRPGRAAFQAKILRNYGFKCAISGTAVRSLLEASHIQPYISRKSDHAQNGLCLRVDLHRLFDAGLLTIDPSGKIRVSSLLTAADYAALEGSAVSFPSGPSAPSHVALHQHRTKIFKG